MPPCRRVAAPWRAHPTTAGAPAPVARPRSRGVRRRDVDGRPAVGAVGRSEPTGLGDRAPISASTRTTPSTGTRGATRPSTGPGRGPSRASCRWATRPVTGATSWRTSPSRTTSPPRSSTPVRRHQGGPRRASRRRRRVHGSGPGHDRQRRMADDGVPHPRRPPLLRRHVLPRRDGPGMPSFRHVLDAVDDVWHDRRDEVEPPGRRAWPRPSSAAPGAPRTCWRSPATTPTSPAPASAALLAAAAAELAARFDATWGGFGPAPKFPQPQLVELCLRHHRARPATASSLAMATTTLGRWQRVGSTTTSGAASPATPPMPPGPSRTSRRCSTTRPGWCAPTCTPGRSRARRWLQVVEETIGYVLARAGLAGRRAVLGPGRRLRG